MKSLQQALLYISIVMIFSLAVISLSDVVPWSTPERESPNDWIKEEQIKVYNDKVIIDVFNPIWAKFTNTNSMDPFIDEDAHAIEIIPEDPQQIKVGDVISYASSEGVIIHRIISTDVDEKGLYFTVKGDNTTIADPVKVRFKDVKGVVVAVIY